MGLLKFHLSFSVLCMLAIFGFRWVFLKSMVRNGWGASGKCGFLKRCFIRLRNALAFVALSFVPIINIAIPWIFVYMASHENPEQEAA